MYEPTNSKRSNDSTLQRTILPNTLNSLCTTFKVHEQSRRFRKLFFKSITTCNILLFLPFGKIVLLGFRHGRHGSLTFLNKFSVFTKSRYKVNNFGHTYSNRVWLVWYALVRRLMKSVKLYNISGDRLRYIFENNFFLLILPRILSSSNNNYTIKY